MPWGSQAGRLIAPGLGLAARFPTTRLCVLRLQPVGFGLCLGACFMAQTQDSQLFLLLAALIVSPPSSTLKSKPEFLHLEFDYL